MEPNVTPLTVLLFVQAVLLALSALNFVSPDISKIITILLIVIDAALAVFFNTSPGKVVYTRMTTKPKP